MTTNSIRNAFINALLADASYVDGLSASIDLAAYGPLQTRLTPTLAQYLADNFEVVTQKLTNDNTESGFDATVWREKSTGQIYVSMRGTEGLADFAADVDLTVSGMARKQVIDMVNWWLKSTAAIGANASQIKFETISGPGGTLVQTDNIVAATPVAGDGRIPIATSVIVNGHSLGGHLATAFSRIFGSTTSHTYTYNSATFNPLSPAKFGQIAAALGTGPTAYPGNAADTNFRATNGPDLTTQNLTAGQIGMRIDLFNEMSLDVLTVPNHFMYKLTDALALGNALFTLDPSLSIDKLNQLLSAGSNHINVLGANDVLIGGAIAEQIDGYACVHTKTPRRYYKKSSCSRNYLLGYRAKRHVKASSQEVQA